MAQNPQLIQPIYINIIKAVIVFAALIVPVWAGSSTLLSIQRVSALQAGSIDPPSHAAILAQKQRVSHPQEWAETARLTANLGSENTARAISLLESALSAAPEDYQSWALLAFFRKQEDGNLSPEAALNLSKSIEACPYCSKSLLRWRFTFVLDNWDAVSEEVKLSAFSGADFLRWWHLDYDYLDQVRSEAISRSIPFDQYRLKVDTPARPNEISVDED